MRTARPIPTLTQEQIERFYASFTINQETGCWEWIKGKNEFGYGIFYFHKQRFLAHRVSYSLVKGQPILTNHLDHLCRNTKCVNPAHLEDVTPAVNILRGVGCTAKNAVKTHCPRGHKLEGNNLINSMKVRGTHAGRACRSCDVAGRKARHLKLQGEFREAFIKRESEVYFNRYIPAIITEVAA